MTKEHAALRDSLPPIPKGLVPLQNQLAGHIFGDKDNVDVYGILDAKDGTILKPCTGRKGLREAKFYQLVFGHYGENGDGIYHKELANEPALQELRKYIPAFYGTKTFIEHPGVLYLHLEDLSRHFSKPCLADIKIGKVTWDPDASPEKAKRESSKYPWLNEVCFQLLGMRCYNEEGHLLVFDRWYGRSLSPDRLLHEGFGTLFGGGPRHLRRVIVEEVLEQLRAIEAWFERQQFLAIYASSLFVAFECQPPIKESHVNGPRNGACEPRRPAVDVRLIDFAHVHPSACIDANCVEGLRSLQDYLKRLLPLLPPPSKNDH